MDQIEYSSDLTELDPNPNNMRLLISFMLKHSQWNLIRMAEMLEISTQELIAVHCGKRELTKPQATSLNAYLKIFLTS